MGWSGYDFLWGFSLVGYLQNLPEPTRNNFGSICVGLEFFFFFGTLQQIENWFLEPAVSEKVSPPKKDDHPFFEQIIDLMVLQMFAASAISFLAGISTPVMKDAALYFFGLGALASFFRIFRWLGWRGASETEITHEDTLILAENPFAFDVKREGQEHDFSHASADTLKSAPNQESDSEPAMAVDSEVAEKPYKSSYLRRAGIFGLGTVSALALFGFFVHQAPQLKLLAVAAALIITIPLCFMAFFNLFFYCFEPRHSIFIDQAAAEKGRDLDREYRNRRPCPKKLRKHIDEMNWSALQNRFEQKVVEDWKSFVHEIDALPIALSEEFLRWSVSVIGVLRYTAYKAADKDQEVLSVWLRDREFKRREMLLLEDRLKRVLGLSEKFPELENFISAWMKIAVVSPAASVLGFACPLDRSLDDITHRCDSLRKLWRLEDRMRENLKGDILARQNCHEDDLVPDVDGLNSSGSLQGRLFDSQSIGVSCASNTYGDSFKDVSTVSNPLPPSGQVDRRTVIVLR